MSAYVVFLSTEITARKNSTISAEGATTVEQAGGKIVEAMAGSESWKATRAGVVMGEFPTYEAAGTVKLSSYKEAAARARGVRVGW